MFVLVPVARIASNRNVACDSRGQGKATQRRYAIHSHLSVSPFPCVAFFSDVVGSDKGQLPTEGGVLVETEMWPVMAHAKRERAVEVEVNKLGPVGE